MSQTGRMLTPLLFVLLAAGQSALAQRRAFTNEDIQTTPSPAPAAPAAAPSQPAAQPAGQASPAAAPAAAAGEAAQPVDENAAKRAEAEKLIQRMMEIQTAIREAGDVFFEKTRERTAPLPTINKWNQVRDNLVLASDELGLFINEARRNLPPPPAPASPAATAPN